MSWTLMKYDWRSLLKITVLPAFLAVAATLFLPAPLTLDQYGGHYYQVVYGGLAILTAIAVSVNVLADSAGVDTWVLTRGLTRRTLFQTRWVSGVFALMIVQACIAVVMLTGLRQLVQTAMGNGAWYPMVRTGELNVLRDFTLTGLATYCAAGFFICVEHFGSRGGNRGLLAGLQLLLPVVAAFAAGLCWQMPLSAEVVPFPYYLTAWLVVCVVLTLAARASYAEREIV